MMSELLGAKKKGVSIADLHSAIETLAIQQADIGLAVLRLLAADALSPEEKKHLYDDVNSSVEILQSLARRFLDIPYGN